jgi:UDP-N-acetylmuramate--alanine ligase
MSHFHFIGIGGTGLSAIALILCQQGYLVSGSDQQESSYTQRLRAAGATIYLGQDPSQVQGADVVIRSSAVPDHNPEVQAAWAAGIPVQKRQDFLGDWMVKKIGIGVAGTHGKTTTTALLALALQQLGADPTFIIGGELAALGGNARAGNGPHFVIEADEYDRMFLGLRPTIAVLTNLEFDHPDIYPDFASLQEAVQTYVRLLPPHGHLIACNADLGATQIASWAKQNGIAVTSYGFAPTVADSAAGAVHPDWQAINCHNNALGGSDFTAYHAGQPVAEVHLQIPGNHNILNALAVLATLTALGFSPQASADTLTAFHGVKRRFEVKGTVAGRTVIDDYAHHPTEIRATLAAARQRYPDRPLWVFFQPHTFSRTTALLTDFANCFGAADAVIISDIYAAREVAAPDSVQAAALRQHITVSTTPPAQVHYQPTLAACTDYLLNNLPDKAVLLTLGAGNGDQVGESLLQHWRQ